MAIELKESPARILFWVNEGYWPMRSFGDGLVIGVRDFAFTTGLCVGLDLSGYRRRYCYARRWDAEAALADWDGHGDPPGPRIKVKPTDRLGPGAEAISHA